MQLVRRLLYGPEFKELMDDIDRGKKEKERRDSDPVLSGLSGVRQLKRKAEPDVDRG